MVGGCLGALLLVAGLAAVGSYFFMRNFSAGRYSCLPSDFPVYPGASYQGVNTFVGTGGNRCRVVLDATASASEVQDYYQTQLATGRWKVAGYDTNQGVLSFTRSDSSRVRGTVGFLSHGAHTEIDIEVDS